LFGLLSIGLNINVKINIDIKIVRPPDAAGRSAIWFGATAHMLRLAHG